MSQCDIIYAPIKFLGATVLSFNSTLGLGSSESTLKVDLIEDCEAIPPDSFDPQQGRLQVGAPAYFQAGKFNFGGVLTSWSENQGGSGKTFSADLSDPRQLLSNSVVIIDSYLGPPASAINFFNVYNKIEGAVLQGNCTVFGLSNSNGRGMPYKNIISALQQMNPTIYSPTGYAFTINFNTFPQNLPDYYRVPGPSITILQLLEDVCEVLGYEFYVDLFPGANISIGLIDLKSPPGSFRSIVTAYDGRATDLSYGQELRNEITKTVLFGEQQHYLSRVTQFSYYFGEELINNKLVPVVPISQDDCGFWINKKIDTLNSMLSAPFPTNGPFKIHELDIRCAMSTMEMWMIRVFDKEFENKNNTFNQALQGKFPDLKTSFAKIFEESVNAISDKSLNPLKANVKRCIPETFTELEITYGWMKNLANTYYGKQFIAPLNQKICYYQLEDNDKAEKFFSDIPTNAGGWVEDGNPVLGLSDPDLGIFREDDNRVSSFALFNNSGNYDTNEPDTNEAPSTSGSYIGDVTPPTNPTV